DLVTWSSDVCSSELGVEAEVRGREAERPASGIAGDDGSLDLGRTTEKLRRPLDLARAQEVADAARRDSLRKRHRARVDAEPSEQVEIARPPAAEAEVGARDHDLCPDRPQHRIEELLRLELREFEIELDYNRFSGPRLPTMLL